MGRGGIQGVWLQPWVARKCFPAGKCPEPRALTFIQLPLPRLTICFCLLALQHHPGPPPVPLGDCRGPVQVFRLHQRRGAGRQLHEFGSHPAGVPGPAEGASGLLSLLQAGESAGDSGLHLCHPHRALCARLNVRLAEEALKCYSLPSALRQVLCGPNSLHFTGLLIRPVRSSQSSVLDIVSTFWGLLLNHNLVLSRSTVPTP